MSWPPQMAIRALNFPPGHLADAGLTVPGTTEDVSPITEKMAQVTGLGSGLGWYTSMPQHSGRRPLTFTPQALRGLDYGLRPSVCPSSCLQGCMVGSYAS